MGVVLATILLQMIANALGLMHIDDNTKTFINGCMLVAALLLDVYLDKRAAKRA
jgi:ribose/xylose/arabinose/galactoside ABC-type transport system permease subunit